MKRIKSIFRFHHSRRRGCRGCRTGCFLLFLLLAALICGVIFLFLPQTARAAPALQTDSLPPTHVFLLIDNSNSMFEKGGIGSDPALLRIDAARLFLAYLGVDEPDTPHQAGVIFFGSQAKTAVPLTLLTTDQQRAQLFAQIADPPRLGWTDHLAALDLAQSQLSASPRTAIILLTDGKPEWANAPTKTEQTAYVSALQTKSAELAQAGIPLFIILLANQATDGDPDIAAIWQPLWRQMSAATPPGRFFIARAAADLPGIYHDIVVALTGNETVGIILNTAVPDNGSQTTIHIPPNLARLTLVISKTDPAQTITLTAGDGRPLADSGVTIRRAGGDGRTREEVWVIEQPPPGEWTLHVEGLGRVTIWQDIKPGPTPTPASAPSSTPAPTAVPQPTLTARPTVTAAITPSPPPKLTPTPRPTATPSIAAFVPAAPVRPVEATPPQPRWPWLLTGAAGLGLASGGLYWRCRPRPAVITGALRLLDGAQTTDGRILIDLDNLNQTTLTIGKSPADIPLANAQAQAIIRPGAMLSDAREMLISGHNPFRLNNAPPTHETRLTDTAILDFGGVRAQYENLRLRRAEREAAFSNPQVGIQRTSNWR